MGSGAVGTAQVGAYEVVHLDSDISVNSKAGTAVRVVVLGGMVRGGAK